MKPQIHDTSPVDASLRRGLDPASTSVERIVRRALEERPEPRGSIDRRGRWVSAVAAAAVAAAVALVVLAVWIVPRLRPTGSPERPEAQVSMVNVGSIIVIETGRDRGKVLLSGASATGDASWRGQIIIQRRERP